MDVKAILDKHVAPNIKWSCIGPETCNPMPLHYTNHIHIYCIKVWKDEQTKVTE